MDFASYLVRQHWLVQREFLKLAWYALSADGRDTTHDGYLEPSLREIDSNEIDRVRPYPFGDVLKNHNEFLANVLKRSGLSSFDAIVDSWHAWHVENIQPISDFCLSPEDPRPFGKRLFDNATEKRLCGEVVADLLVQDADHVIIPEGTSAYWVGLAVLARRSNLQIITSNGALVRELHENPQLRSRAAAVHVIGGNMDVDVGGTGRGFVGGATEAAFQHVISNTPGATVVISSVNGLTPEKGPFAPCPITGFTRRELLMHALGSKRVRTVVLVADHSKVRPVVPNVRAYGNPIFADAGQWRDILHEYHDRLAVVVAPPSEVRRDATLMAVRPSTRNALGNAYSPPVVDYLSAAARFDEQCSTGGLDSRFYEAADTPKWTSKVASRVP